MGIPSLIGWMLFCVHPSVTGSAQNSPWTEALGSWPTRRPVISEQIMLSWFTTLLSSVSFSLIFLPTPWGQGTWRDHVIFFMGRGRGRWKLMISHRRFSMNACEINI